MRGGRHLRRLNQNCCGNLVCGLAIYSVSQEEPITERAIPNHTVGPAGPAGTFDKGATVRDHMQEWVDKCLTIIVRLLPDIARLTLMLTHLNSGAAGWVLQSFLPDCREPVPNVGEPI
jgi:hypothetical protein